jgi:hypothetical protein
VAIFTAPQTPSLPDPFFAKVQARQPPAQAWSQQTPSTQNPETHSLALEHAEPLALSPLQVDVDSLHQATSTQIASPEQLVAH